MDILGIRKVQERRVGDEDFNERQICTASYA
jgi:hypothetical protein